jgi:PAS domain-containing protein
MCNEKGGARVSDGLVPGLVLHTEPDALARTITTIIGEVDIATVAQLTAHLAALPFPPDVIDCRFVSFMDASGLGALARQHALHAFDVVMSNAMQLVLDAARIAEVLVCRAPTSPPALHHTASAVAVHDAALRFVYANDALAQFNGLPAQAHYGHRGDELFEPTVDELTPVLERVLRTRRSDHLLVKAEIDGRQELLACSYYYARYGDAEHVVAIVHASTDATLVQPAVRLTFSTPVVTTPN